MTALVWGQLKDRVFESGVECGVLYVDGRGHAWPGLLSVSENITGGETTPYHYDGLRYINVSAIEEFTATIQAFSAPKAFDLCDGIATISNGLFATDQPRRPFALSYQTRVGDGLEGVDHGYKIHIVYNAISSPASKNHKTIGATTTPEKLSWTVETTPPWMANKKGFAHFVIDSTKSPYGLMLLLEAMLYGTDISDAYLPDPLELSTLLASYAPSIWQILDADRNFPPETKEDNLGYHVDSGSVYWQNNFGMIDETAPVAAFWELVTTGDFPSEALHGDLGLVPGDNTVWINHKDYDVEPPTPTA